jgi:serine/threonine-protein kinase
MAPGLLLGPGMMERFKQEAVTVASLQHAHIVSIYGVRQIGDLHFFVMQFVPGRTLEGVLRDVGALPIPVVRAWLYEIGSALGYAHRRGVIHRDIKPGNILLNADGEAIVTDFGIAKVAESPNQTQTGTVVGTPVYMSPEQCYAKELTGASDQYSLGVVAYEMLVGRPPFSGSSFALMRAHTDTPPPSLQETRPDVPPAMEAAIMRMLAKTPEERFPSLAEALVSLGATPLAHDDPLHAELQKLAAAAERLNQLADIVRTPASPVPKTRERPKQPVSKAAAPTAPVAGSTVQTAPDEPTVVQPAVREHATPPAKRGAFRWAVPAALAVALIGYLALKPPAPSAPAPQPLPQESPAPTAAPPNAVAPANPDSVADPVTTAPRSVDSSSARRVPAPTAPPTVAPATTAAGRATAKADSGSPRRQPVAEPKLPAASVPNVVSTIDSAASRPAARLDTPAAPPSAPPAPPPKSEAELRTEIQDVLASYVRAIEQRDTSAIRRVFPNAGSVVMSRWQGTFDDARGPINMSGGTINILDTPRDAVGTQVQVRAQYSARFSSKAARSEQSFPVAFTAVVQRDPTGWHIAGIR